MSVVKVLLATVYWIGLLLLRAWYSVFIAFVGVSILRAALNALHDGDRSSGAFLVLGSLAFLGFSFLLFLRAARQIRSVRELLASQARDERA